MTEIKNLKFNLNTNGTNVAISIEYEAVFSIFERHLAGLGLRFQERINVIGVDPSTADTPLIVFSSLPLPVTDGTIEQPIPRVIKKIVPRALLDEDPFPLPLPTNPDIPPDEIRCRIQILAIDLPPVVTGSALTDVIVLSGVVQQIADTNSPLSG